MTKLWKIAAVLSLAVGALTVPAIEAVAAPGWHEGQCTPADPSSVTVVVDFQQLGGSPLVRCAFGLPSTARGSAALAATQIPVAGVGNDNGAFVCRLAGRPAADETIAVTGNPGYTETCQSTPPAAAYWSYWWAAPEAGWTYSSLGAQTNRVKFGGFEGWSFSLNATAQTNLPPRFDVLPVAGTFRSLSPVRLLDTRVVGGRFAPAEEREVTVAGVGGVPASASAVQLNLTAVDPADVGFASVWPAGGAATMTSAINYRPGSAPVANAAVVGVGAGGKVRFRLSAPAHLIADVTGYFVGGTAQDAGTYVPVTPTRVADTRDGSGQVPGSTARAFAVSGRAGVPQDVGAVAINITAVAPQSDGYLSIVRTPGEIPATSTLNTVAGVPAIANSTVTTVDAQGRVLIRNSGTGGVHLVIDVVGYYRPGTPTAFGAFQPVAPRRMADTRNSSAVGPQSVLSVDTRAPNGPGSGWGSSALLNVTAVQPEVAGWLTVQPGAGPSSTLNFLAGQTVPNAAVAPVATRVLNASGGRTQVIVDVLGYYLG